MIRLSDDASIPHYHEWVPLRGRVRAAGWTLGAAAVVLGLVVAGVTDGAAGRVFGPFSVAVGGLTLAALFRWRRYEVSVGTKRIDLGAEPFYRLVPTGAVESTARRPATAWRRLYADEEIVLRVSVGVSEVAVPSHKTDELLAALVELADG